MTKPSEKLDENAKNKNFQVPIELPGARPELYPKRTETPAIDKEPDSKNYKQNQK